MGTRWHRHRVTEENVARVRAMRSMGTSIRAIARELGMSRGTVQKLASDKYQLHHGGRVCKRKKSGKDEYEPTGEIGVCPNCEHSVRLPCLACKVDPTGKLRGIKLNI